MNRTPRVDWRAEWERRKAAFVETTWRAMMRDPAMREIYFYHTRSVGTTWGELYAVPAGAEIPAEAELVCAERIPAGTREQIAHWVGQKTARLPVIPPEI
jgi:hypothetical protein